jgi:hypothetical protein
MLEAPNPNLTPTTVAVPVTLDGLHVLDYERHTYMALSRDGSYWHLVRPAQEGEYLVGTGRIQIGQLTCSCDSGRTRGTCYQTARAEAFEAWMAYEAFWADTPLARTEQAVPA